MWSEEHCINAAISIVSSGGQMAKHILSRNCPFMTDKVSGYYYLKIQLTTETKLVLINVDMDLHNMYFY